MMQIVYATTNPGKFSEVQKIFAHHNVGIKSLLDYGINQDVIESGDTLEANAKIKALAYQKLLPKDVIVVADDTGIEIDALGGEPGIKVRRWKGYKMEDEEIIEYCLKRMEKVKEGERGAQFRTVLAVAGISQDVVYFDGILRGKILDHPQSLRKEGMPFWPIFFIPKLNMTLGDFHSSSIDFQLKNPTHRELAVLKFLNSSIFAQPSSL
jgi:XTP/dITP diphosphohydrolase